MSFTPERAMFPPIRCFTCNAVLNFAEASRRMREEGAATSEAMDAMGVSRYCCRRMLLCQPHALAGTVAQFRLDDHVSEKYNFNILMSMCSDRTLSAD